MGAYLSPGASYPLKTLILGATAEHTGLLGFGLQV